MVRHPACDTGRPVRVREHGIRAKTRRQACPTRCRPHDNTDDPCRQRDPRSRIARHHAARHRHWWTTLCEGLSQKHHRDCEHEHDELPAGLEGHGAENEHGQLSAGRRALEDANDCQDREEEDEKGDALGQYERGVRACRQEHREQRDTERKPGACNTACEQIRRDGREQNTAAFATLIAV